MSVKYFALSFFLCFFKQKEKKQLQKAVPSGILHLSDSSSSIALHFNTPPLFHVMTRSMQFRCKVRLNNVSTAPIIHQFIDLFLKFIDGILLAQLDSDTATVLTVRNHASCLSSYGRSLYCAVSAGIANSIEKSNDHVMSDF